MEHNEMICTVNGYIAPGIACGEIIIGTKQCGCPHPCVHQKKCSVPMQIAPATANFPCGSLGEEVEA